MTEFHFRLTISPIRSCYTLVRLLRIGQLQAPYVAQFELIRHLSRRALMQPAPSLFLLLHQVHLLPWNPASSRLAERIASWKSSLSALASGGPSFSSSARIALKSPPTSQGSEIDVDSICIFVATGLFSLLQSISRIQMRKPQLDGLAPPPGKLLSFHGCEAR